MGIAGKCGQGTSFTMKIERAVWDFHGESPLVHRDERHGEVVMFGVWAGHGVEKWELSKPGYQDQVAGVADWAVERIASST